MSRNILVVVEVSPAGRQALETAVTLAQRAGGRLTILTPVVRPPAWLSTPMAGAACGPLAQELEREAAAALDAARERVPGDVPLTTILTRRPLCEAVQRRLAEHPHDLLVLPAGRAARRLARRAPVPVQAVAAQPAPAATAPAPPRRAGSRRARHPIAARPAR